MNNKLSEIWRSYPYLNFLTVGLLLVAALGVLSSAAILVTTGIGGEFGRPLCFDNACIKKFIELYDQSFLILTATLNLLVGVATIGGIIVALMSFLNSANATALTNHISHFSIFQSYVTLEISKRNRISATSVDTFVWYNLIFSNSRTGKISISNEYCSIISALNNEISLSNEQARTAVQGSFRYMPHQRRIIDALACLGIALTHQPRNEFYEIEDQVFALISSLNKSFCYSDKVPSLLKRHYV
ncbi:retron Ec48 family effector membrane protein [Pseudomonas petrae]|uniref:retron Ec48 family effector membrane protein n=1 Tax=Pseudomonas petrae TaxID=2912190 RepID=UPI001EF08E82|nr:retron Ec48 family effector membrane protein [Pseudomonas petrae]MCF7535573.1 retron Ec48 family effector membrane protein [Pseudomonas petrae]MCF7540595.1 retron Ec48 family effector membrane protein [Pseudomonas petrae]MCF7558994.1 retron Ec48 family effector membrane protein [Pseudomonas petrae]